MELTLTIAADDTIEVWADGEVYHARHLVTGWIEMYIDGVFKKFDTIDAVLFAIAVEATKHDADEDARYGVMDTLSALYDNTIPLEEDEDEDFDPNEIEW